MKRKQIDYIWLNFSIVSFLLLGISFLLMSVDVDVPSEQLPAVSLIAGIIFWLSLISGIVSQCILTFRRRKWAKKNLEKNTDKFYQVGIFMFFKNKYAIVADCLSLITLIGLVISMIVTRGTGFVCYIFVAIFVFSFSMHCILNGKNYVYITNQDGLSKKDKKSGALKAKKERKRKNG